MSQSSPEVDGTIVIFVADYDRLHFRIVPANGRRLGTPPRGLLSPKEAHLRRQLYTIPEQDSPDLWVPRRRMSNLYYEFTTRQMPPEKKLSSPMITHAVLEGQRRLAFQQQVCNIIIDAFGWQNCKIVTPTPTTGSVFQSVTNGFKALLTRIKR